MSSGLERMMSRQIDLEDGQQSDRVDRAPDLDADTPPTPRDHDHERPRTKIVLDSHAEELEAERAAQEISDSNDSSYIGTINTRHAIFKGCVVLWFTVFLVAILSWQLRARDPEPLKLVTRAQWDEQYEAPNSKKIILEQVAISHSETEACDSTLACEKLLNEINHKILMTNNFLMATNGDVYEALGWHVPSPLYDKNPTMVVSFIGNYATTAPAQKQINQFKKLLNDSVKLNYLRSTYKIYGRRSNVFPTKLFECLEEIVQIRK